MRSILEASAKSAVPNSGEEHFISSASNVYRGAPLDHYDIFVASFSERGDDLSQWRAYGATGSGRPM